MRTTKKVPKRKETPQEKYSKSEKAKKAREKYADSEKGQGATLRYQLSPKGKRTYKRRLALVHLFNLYKTFLKGNPGKTLMDFLNQKE